MEAAGKLFEGLASLGWIALIAFVIYRWRAEFRAVLAGAAERVRSGSGFELGPFKFSQLDLLAVVGQPVEEREAGEVTITTDAKLQEEIVRQQESERYAFLCHYVFPRRKDTDPHDVALYLTGHFNRLEQVTRVEHFLGEGWGDAVFASEDRVKRFAIKVGAVGSFLAMARVHFDDGSTTTEHRFVELKPLY